MKLEYGKEADTLFGKEKNIYTSRGRKLGRIIKHSQHIGNGTIMLCLPRKIFL